MRECVRDIVSEVEGVESGVEPAAAHPCAPASQRARERVCETLTASMTGEAWTLWISNQPESSTPKLMAVFGVIVWYLAHKKQRPPRILQ